jgi:hypothetical protein
MNDANKTTPATRRGSCHCGTVRFQVELDLAQGLSRCNCTICTKIGSTGTCVKPAAFTLLAGADNLGVYAWGGRISVRYFCKTCGIHTFSRGFLAEVGGDFVGINGNCLDDVDLAEVKVNYWDGRHNNWEGGVRETPWPVFTDAASPVKKHLTA